jgi:UDP-N-acetylglucosamine 2-epimerase (non-hydrolysing)
MITLPDDGVDLVVVQGDTSTALGGALAAFSAGIPVAHVEAGLRTHDPLLPWPEEEYRTAIDAQADLLFAPTELAARNLHAEDVRGEVYVTGNTGIDALLAMEPALRVGRTPRQVPRLLVTCHRRESWGEGLDSIAAALRQIAAVAQIEFVLHPNPHVACAMRSLLGGVDSITLLPPCGHRELLDRMQNADLVLSDSGGIQEEAPALGVPLLVLREKTERPEGIAAGNAVLVGTDRDRIIHQVQVLLSDPEALARMARPCLPYGDGHAAPRIATVIEQWLERRDRPPPKSSAVPRTAEFW